MRDAPATNQESVAGARRSSVRGAFVSCDFALAHRKVMRTMEIARKNTSNFQIMDLAFEFIPIIMGNDRVSGV